MATLKAYPNGGSLGLAGGRRCQRGRHEQTQHNFLAHDCCHTKDCACHSPERTLCCKHAPAKRGNVTGWTRGAVRRHKTWLYSVDVAGLDGEGYGVTLTLRDTPATHKEWRDLVARLHRAFREAGLSRWHWVVEWQRRGTPHLHLAVYAPPGWESPISDIGWRRRGEGGCGCSASGSGSSRGRRHRVACPGVLGGVRAYFWS